MNTTSKHQFFRSAVPWVLATILGVAILAYALPPASSSGSLVQNAAWVVGL